jgi:hypothetical protein
MNHAPYCVILFACAGCWSSDRNEPVSSTRHKLDVLGRVALKWRRQEIAGLNSVHEFVRESVNRGYLAEVTEKYYELDFWDRELRWSTRLSEGNLIVQIASTGPGGVFRDEDGLFVEVEFPIGGQPRIRPNSR